MNFLRNRIRHELIPHLATYNPAIATRLADTATTLSADEALLERITGEAMDRLAVAVAGKVSFSVAELAAQPRGVRMRLFRQALLMVRGDLERISLRHLEAIDGLVASGRPQRRLSLPGDVAVTRSYGTLAFTATEAPSPAGPFEKLLEGPGSYPLPGGGTLTIDEAVPPADWSVVPADTVWFDAGSVPFPWLVRTFRPGDRMIPFGMTGSKKVKELFIDAKVPQRERRSIPLVFSGGQLIWACGVRVAEGARVRAGAPKAIRATVIG
jgi:tRNA(Ile)-lysidine synthase